MAAAAAIIEVINFVLFFSHRASLVGPEIALCQFLRFFLAYIYSSNMVI